MHYVLIDNYSGFVWGEADAQSPIEACRIVDRKTADEARVYEETWFGNSTESGYHVYAAPNDWTPVSDGTLQTEIDRVADLPKVAEVATKLADT